MEDVNRKRSVKRADFKKYIRIFVRSAVRSVFLMGGGSGKGRRIIYIKGVTVRFGLTF